MTVAVITSMTAYLYLYSHGMVSHAASQPVSAISLSTLSSAAWLEHYIGLIWISWSTKCCFLGCHWAHIKLDIMCVLFVIKSILSWIHFVKCFRVVLLRGTPQCMFHGENVSVGYIQGWGSLKCTPLLTAHVIIFSQPLLYYYSIKSAELNRFSFSS